eukprot:CAMPEP_0176074664 /NCGR_PEP_ID=MMETSP0120_2-20121206/37313_1 /TAXON_ID=160619 /ORGANISM="Kryptoperidinium foliaceum, Strain CCMP 1326" /LENGTH=210 /DNA_ID=CAMNT_0017408359 /DNA_START=38 /DNA_END=666 /DNA_ORIENTATION=-
MRTIRKRAENKTPSLQVLLLEQARLDDCVAPVLPAVVAGSVNASARLRLLLIQTAQDAIDDGSVVLEVEIHDALRHSFADVLKMHRLALDEATDADDAVETLRLKQNLRSERDLVGAGHVLDHDVIGGHTACLHSLDAPLSQGLADNGVPTGADDGDLQACAIEGGEVEAADGLRGVGVRRIVELPLLRHACRQSGFTASVSWTLEPETT